MHRKYKKGFALGYRQIRTGDLRIVRGKLLTALGVTTNVSLLRYMRGVRECKASQAAAVESVFKEYNITEIWGD